MPVSRTRPSQNLETAIAWTRRGQIFDMDDALEQVLKGEKVVIEWSGKRRLVTITGVSNQGFNGQIAHFRFADQSHGQRPVHLLPATFQAKMIKKFHRQ